MDQDVINKTRFAELLDAEFARPLAIHAARKMSNFDPIRHVARASGKHFFEYTPEVHVVLKREPGGYTLSIT